jgi:predicted RND superfamily exporter protein
MTREKTYFGIGLVIGIVVSALFLLFFAPRYTTSKSGDTLIKQDKWSGRSWQYAGGSWQEIRSVDSRQEEIDKELRKAMMVIVDQTSLNQAMVKFKELFPALKDVPDDELLSRMSTFYSREITSALFLQSYHYMLQEKAKAFKPAGSGQPATGSK